MVGIGPTATPERTMLAKIPVWVFPLFVLLLALGWRQATTRTLRPALLAWVGVAMVGLSLAGVVTMPGPGAALLLAWATGLALALSVGRPVFHPGPLAMAGARVQVPGSLMPLVLMMTIFAAKFSIGFATGLGVAMVSSDGFQFVSAGLFGLLSGGFAARGLAVWQFARAGTGRPVLVVPAAI